MEKTVEMFSQSLVGIRGGTITPSLVDTVKVVYYGQPTPVRQIAHTSVTKGGISVTPFEPTMLGPIEKALKAANLTAYTFSKTCIMVSVPPITGEEKTKIRAYIKKLGEESKVSVRNIRKTYKQSAQGSKDEVKRFEKDLQNLTDAAVSAIDEIVDSKCAAL